MRCIGYELEHTLYPGLSTCKHDLYLASKIEHTCISDATYTYKSLINKTDELLTFGVCVSHTLSMFIYMLIQEKSLLLFED